MLFWHGQPDHYWSSPGEMYPISGPGLLRDPPVLPYLKQEEPHGISTSQPPCSAFEYVLCAPTSPAVRHHEETLTYLNQGQSYEIRMMGNPRLDPGGEGRRMLKSVVRVVFHDRRLQYSEQQQLEGWRWSRPGDRILDIGSLHQHRVHAAEERGEKGVPFRIQIDTFGVGGKGDPPEHLHSASCLVKVFKPKGADRKQKTDREKVEKRPAPEREKFQPAYETTVLAEALSPCASPLETQQWLHKRRFSAYTRVFANFAGADLLKLSRRDLIRICGAPDGIRLCNALTGRCPRPRLTLYVSRELAGGAEGAEDGCSGLYQEMHLEELTVAELTGKLAELLGLPVGQILRVSRQGPSGIHILVSDVMIRNLLDETCFVVAISKGNTVAKGCGQGTMALAELRLWAVHGPEGYRLVLR
ncbi:transcription factor CP2-like protein 1 [Grus japonensis]|uniref:Transcription factor CP2-like protein 1 n=1 Tax=Grus japonensis TaxID=30415 RepID=A0ABC9XN72_GRUJA